ncbi:hypothetical protein O6H91_16G005600 [Diphasiastrum complanatum]|uniref:Uncharacterized protein n=2 Tax=Diphasiastrum complanatum TaxID=34168 RepID=A0ACC2B9I8_DIPCM|nr:hypothetical protein O6H91_16G005300 [Diphasiastrum complanatum]KAJ7526421.1 hypothetical protein O6H91_16G005600 [Diphasiastrum complanatum]
MYYTKANSDGLEEGVHFYKRHISTKKLVGNLSDAFRKHPLQRDIAFELKSELEVNASYRFLVRALNLKKPFLHLIIVNDDSWLQILFFSVYVLVFSLFRANGLRPCN